MPENITFRAHLIGNISDFASSCSMGTLCSPEILVELIINLSRYREEGTKLSPEVYLCNNITNLVQLLPDHGLLHINQLQLSITSINKVLKECAPLAIDGWCIYIEGNNSSIKYGLFRSSISPLSVPIDETLFSSKEIKVVKIHQTAEDCVEIKNYQGEHHNIFLSHKKETTPAPTKSFDDLINAICEKVPEQYKEPSQIFLKKAVRDALSKSHGCLIAICRTSKIPQFLSDGIALKEPIDFPAKVELFKGRMKDAPSSDLSSQAALLKGMINSDGVVIFSCDAKLLAYHCFITYTNNRTQPSGGGRRRAFETLCSKLGKGISAVFIQSQDGWTDFRRISK